MDRRAFLAGSVALLAAPPTAGAQETGKVYRIGILRSGPLPKPWAEALRAGLQERGYVEGRNVVVEYRLTDGSLKELPGLVEELVRLRVDLIVASGLPAIQAAQKATTAVPIVFVNVYDPVEIGLVASLARPGGNLTGLSQNSADLVAKRLELLKELLPNLRRVAFLWHSTNPGNVAQKKGAEIAARAVGVQLQSLPVEGQDEFESAFRDARGAGGLLQADDSLFTTHRSRLTELAIRSRLPAIYSLREHADAGGLMSYGTNYPDQLRRTATYIDKILKGAKPADLPVEEPTKFELVINLKTAKALGLTIPPSVLARADEVIQ